MRAQTEKIARRLNEIHRQVNGASDTEFALAHHGSISREVRYDIEARLKAGQIPAVIATASLELGIDIGSIDLVVHLEAPKNVSGALQRVGRSGHLLSATSKGRIIVLYPSDLDDAVTIAHCMHKADIEETKIPENALDVLAQQIVAEVAVQTWDYHALYCLVRQSFCYRNLTLSSFKNVVEMLTGRFSDSPLHALQPRISWDKVNNRLIARRGSRLAAVMNGGTIPDRGYYGVYLKGSNTRLGELEEEFVFESRVGETFFLGNSEWRVDSILQSRIIVTPVAAIKPRAPFWKGGILFRDYFTSKKIGQFRQKLFEKIDQGKAQEWLISNYYADRNTAENLVHYFKRQRKQIQTISTDKRLVVESSVNADGEPLIILHAPFGARVNGAWAIALAAALERHCHTQIQYSFDDDGILIRLPEITDKPPMNKLFQMSAEDIERYLITALPESPIFAVQFRYNAARSLLLPRSQPKKRIPLWLQRLRAADLLQAVQQHNEFPVIIETFRDCLQDVFDLPTLKKIIRRLNKSRIQIRFADTSYPSPMALNILFKFVATYLYELDKTRRPEQVTGISGQFLADILDHEKIPTILTEELIREAERRWQHLAPEYKAASAEDVFNIIEKLGPIAEDELRKRCTSDPTLWLIELRSAKRILSFEQKHNDRKIKLWMLSDAMPVIDESLDKANLRQRIQQYLYSRGPLDLDRIQTDLKLPQRYVQGALNTLLQEKKVVCGQLTIGHAEKQWCDRQNFMQLYRMAVATRRKVQTPADRQTFNRFLFEWHRINKPGQPLIECIQRYRGLRLPLHFFERNILISRFRRLKDPVWHAKVGELENLISNGDVIALSGKDTESGRRYIQFRLRGDGYVFFTLEALLAKARQLSKPAHGVFNFLKENGASYMRDMEMGTGLTRQQLQQALQELADRSLASCENYQALLLVLQFPHKQPSNIPSRFERSLRGVPDEKKVRPTRSAIRKMVQEQTVMKEGRWFLTSSFAIMGISLSESERATNQARVLLQRYGILVKEFYRREHGLLTWYKIFQALKRLEWQGEIRRGYFVDGLSGIQYALPEALDLLEKIQNEQFSSDNLPVLLSSMDPALPYGGAVGWEIGDSNDIPLKIVRSPSNHLAFVDGQPVLYGENFFDRLSITGDLSEDDFVNIAQFFKAWLKLPSTLRSKNHIEINQINDTAAALSKYADQFLTIGYEKDGNNLVLWPSAI
jgi:ATP-dependent Lhr-like helicase